MADVLTVTVLRPPGRNRFGDPLSAPLTTRDIGGCLFAPGPSKEHVAGGANQIETDGTVYAPPGVDIVATDRIQVRGDVYEVVGQPQNWGSAGTVIVLHRVTG